ncbi:MAG: biopolymer transporter ExbD [Elusimicrobiales bacterium]
MKIHNPGKGVMADINMIPLIDVALILLIIFMVMTPFLVQSQITVQLPKSSQGAAAQGDSIIHIQIAPGGAVTVEGKRVPLRSLERELILRLSKSAKRTVLVQADKSVPVEQLVLVLDIARKLGAGKLGIAVANRQ